MRRRPGRIMTGFLLPLALAGGLLAGPAATAGAAVAPGTGSLPALYNLGGGPGGVWNLPQVRPKVFYIFADGSAALIRLHWARWTRTRAVTRKAVYYYRTGPCCTRRDQHYRKITVTLSRVRQHGGPKRGPYFVRMKITGPHIKTQILTYSVTRSNGQVFGAWLEKNA
jgi:hypothetical protein